MVYKIDFKPPYPNSPNHWTVKMAFDQILLFFLGVGQRLEGMMVCFVTLALSWILKFIRWKLRSSQYHSDAISIFGTSMDESSSSCIIGTLLAQTMAYRSTAPDPASSRNVVSAFIDNGCQKTTLEFSLYMNAHSSR